MRLALAGGGTGGHVYPALAITRALERQLGEGEKLEVVYIGSAGGAEEEIVRKAGLPLHTITAGPIRGKAPWQVLASTGKIAGGVPQARKVLQDFMPQVLLSTGGYASFPVAIAARSRGIPLAVYLPDLHPGWTVRVIARLAQKIAVTAIESLRKLPSGKAIVTGYPVREEFWQLDRMEGRKRLGLDFEEKVLLVAGGSTGAHHINKAISAELNGLLELCEIVHVCGANDEPWLQEVRDGLPDKLRERYHLFGYMHDDLPWAMAAADLTLCRAGASVIGELPAAGLPAVLVPLPIAGGHQRINARYLQKNGAAVILEDSKLDNVLPVVGHVLHDQAKLCSMHEAARRLARPDAARRIASMLLELGASRGSGFQRDGGAS